MSANKATRVEITNLAVPAKALSEAETNQVQGGGIFGDLLNTAKEATTKAGNWIGDKVYQLTH